MDILLSYVLVQYETHIRHHYNRENSLAAKIYI